MLICPHCEKEMEPGHRCAAVNRRHFLFGMMAGAAACFVPGLGEKWLPGLNDLTADNIYPGLNAAILRDGWIVPLNLEAWDPSVTVETKIGERQIFASLDEIAPVVSLRGEPYRDPGLSDMLRSPVRRGGSGEIIGEAQLKFRISQVRGES